MFEQAMSSDFSSQFLLLRGEMEGYMMMSGRVERGHVRRGVGASFLRAVPHWQAAATPE